MTPQEARAFLFDWQLKTQGAEVRIEKLSPTPTVLHMVSAEVIHGRVMIFDLRTAQATEDEALVVLARELPAALALQVDPASGRECPCCTGQIVQLYEAGRRVTFEHSLPECTSWRLRALEARLPD